MQNPIDWLIEEHGHILYILFMYVSLAFCVYLIVRPRPVRPREFHGGGVPVIVVVVVVPPPILAPPVLPYREVGRSRPAE